MVLDTNVVLDWLFFGDASAKALDTTLRSGALRWVSTAAMRLEAEHVLTRKPFSSGPEAVTAVLAAWDRWAVMVEPAPAATGPAGHCTDPDDQKFIDLALHLGAPTQLISRDRAVLRLARVAARQGVRIVSLADWAAAPQPGFD